MPIGKNAIIMDKLIQNTAKKNIADDTNNEDNAYILGQPSLNPDKGTFQTKKMTFYIKNSSLIKLYNYSFWERYSLTDAFNIVIEDGLKGKKTKNRPDGIIGKNKRGR